MKNNMNNEQRNKKIISLRTQKTPESLEQIGRRFNLSRERIRQILQKELPNHKKYNLSAAGKLKVKRIKLYCAECKKVILMTPRDLELREGKVIFCSTNCLRRIRKRKFRNLLKNGRACLKCGKHKPITAYAIRYTNSEKTNGIVYSSCKSCHGKQCYQNHLKLKKKYPKKLALQQKIAARRYHKKNREKLNEYSRNKYRTDPVYRANLRQSQKEYSRKIRLEKKKKLNDIT